MRDPPYRTCPPNPWHGLGTLPAACLRMPCTPTPAAPNMPAIPGSVGPVPAAPPVPGNIMFTPQPVLPASALELKPPAPLAAAVPPLPAATMAPQRWPEAQREAFVPSAVHAARNCKTRIEPTPQVCRKLIEHLSLSAQSGPAGPVQVSDLLLSQVGDESERASEDHRHASRECLFTERYALEEQVEPRRDPQRKSGADLKM